MGKVELHFECQIEYIHVANEDKLGLWKSFIIFIETSLLPAIAAMSMTELV